MLTVTKTAAQMIASLADQAQLPRRGGLRIVQRSDLHCLEMALVAEPGVCDCVVVTGAARVFLDVEATHRLDQVVLDGRVGDAGPSFFFN